MSDSIFREKSLKRISSPESLNDYVKVSNPGIWVLLTSVIVLLIGFFAWGVFGRLDTKIETVALIDDNKFYVYVKEADIEDLTEESYVVIDGEQYPISFISNKPAKLDYQFEEVYLHMANISKDDWLYKASGDASLQPGSYSATVVTESIKPISLLFN